MSMVEERRKRTTVTRVYSIASIKDADDAIKWLCSIRKTENIDVKYMYMWDIINRSDEGSTDLQLAADVKVEDVIEEFGKREIGIIYIHGMFYGRTVVIGVDLRDNMIRVTVDKREGADITAIENQLHLV